jgi:hypothetical protein
MSTWERSSLQASDTRKQQHKALVTGLVAAALAGGKQPVNLGGGKMFAVVRHFV